VVTGDSYPLDRDPAAGAAVGSLSVAIRVVVAEDSYLIRESVERLLEREPDVDPVAICEDLPGLLAAIERERPDVVLTDIRMPPGASDEGIRVAEELRESRPEIGVVVLSQYAEPRYALRLLAGGSEGRGYLLKERVSDARQLVSAIRQVAAGGSVIDPKLVDALVGARSAAEQSPVSELTPREREVLAEMAQGKNNAAIAAQLVLTERAVEKHIGSIFSKLGLKWEDSVHRRVKAVLIYLSEGGSGTEPPTRAP
jgi:DNA-binding NarL/FixJ family response regulator